MSTWRREEEYTCWGCRSYDSCCGHKMVLTYNTTSDIGTIERIDNDTGKTSSSITLDNTELHVVDRLLHKFLGDL